MEEITYDHTKEQSPLEVGSSILMQMLVTNIFSFSYDSFLSGICFFQGYVSFRDMFLSGMIFSFRVDILPKLILNMAGCL